MSKNNLVALEFGDFSRTLNSLQEHNDHLSAWRNEVLKQNQGQSYRNEETIGILTDIFLHNVAGPWTYTASPKNPWNLEIREEELEPGTYNQPLPKFGVELTGNQFDDYFRKQAQGLINAAVHNILRNEIDYIRMLSGKYKDDQNVQLNLRFRDGYQNFDGNGKGSFVGLGLSYPSTDTENILNYGGDTVLRVGDETDNFPLWLWGGRDETGYKIFEKVLPDTHYLSHEEHNRISVKSSGDE